MKNKQTRIQLKRIDRSKFFQWLSRLLFINHFSHENSLLLLLFGYLREIWEYLFGYSLWESPYQWLPIYPKNREKKTRRRRSERTFSKTVIQFLFFFPYPIYKFGIKFLSITRICDSFPLVRLSLSVVRSYGAKRGHKSRGLAVREVRCSSLCRCNQSGGFDKLNYLPLPWLPLLPYRFLVGEGGGGGKEVRATLPDRCDAASRRVGSSATRCRCSREFERLDGR